MGRGGEDVSTPPGLNFGIFFLSNLVDFQNFATLLPRPIRTFSERERQTQSQEGRDSRGPKKFYLSKSTIFDLFLPLQMPLFLGRYQLSIWCSQRSMRLMQTPYEDSKVLNGSVTSFENDCTVFHLIWETHWGDWNFGNFDLYLVLTAIIDKKSAACNSDWAFCPWEEP